MQKYRYFRIWLRFHGAIGIFGGIKNVTKNLIILFQYQHICSLIIPLKATRDHDKIIAMCLTLRCQLRLTHARGNGDISHVPYCDSLLETAHILRGKGDGPKPVIARFYSRNWRNLVFRNRKAFAPREPPPAAQPPPTPGAAPAEPPA